ncbi:hypothetical protein FNV43_RR07041 [Rhamnella rubrinervis]|uniref:Uncharacterized protein n=1 Tax=Rhamnella rubrinervis TaxID=2594499 RepID=A0A8K0MM04_9ROSA|nr:hypothetical protein FNV43_RR07041 [Rhamnella rubrinervis]
MANVSDRDMPAIDRDILRQMAAMASSSGGMCFLPAKANEMYHFGKLSDEALCQKLLAAVKETGDESLEKSAEELVDVFKRKTEKIMTLQAALGDDAIPESKSGEPAREGLRSLGSPSEKQAGQNLKEPLGGARSYLQESGDESLMLPYTQESRKESLADRYVQETDRYVQETREECLALVSGYRSGRKIQMAVGEKQNADVIRGLVAETLHRLQEKDGILCLLISRQHRKQLSEMETRRRITVDAYYQKWNNSSFI